jgi:hypothetical protein
MLTKMPSVPPAGLENTYLEYEVVSPDAIQAVENGHSISVTLGGIVRPLTTECQQVEWLEEAKAGNKNIQIAYIPLIATNNSPFVGIVMAVCYEGAQTWK